MWFGCKVEFCVHYYNETLKCYVSKFKDSHTGHKLMGLKYNHLIRCHWSLNKVDIAQVNSMCAYGIKTSHIIGFMIRQSKGYEIVGSTWKDLYNHFNKKNWDKLIDRDANVLFASKCR